MWWTCGEAFESQAALAHWPGPGRTAALASSVLSAMRAAGQAGGNASSVHTLGQRARVAVEDAESALLSLLAQKSGSFAYLAEQQAADAVCIEAALQQRQGAKGGCVWFLGEAAHWHLAARALVGWRHGALSALPRSALGVGGWQWCANAPPDAAGQAVPPDVVALDAFSPVTGLAGGPAFAAVSAKVPKAHWHARVGAWHATYWGEAWPFAPSAIDSLSVGSAACGGPGALAVAIALTPTLRLTPQGTTPKELVVGLGEACRLRQENRAGRLARLRQRAEALGLWSGGPERLHGLYALADGRADDAAGIAQRAPDCDFALARSKNAQVGRVWLRPGKDDNACG